MLIAAICDDDSLHLKWAEEMTAAAFNAAGQVYSMNLFSSAEELLQWMAADRKQPDLAVLDIEMDGENGISLAKKLNAAAPACRIIFLTSYVDYAPDVYEAEHIWFVVKSRAEEHFEAAVRKALASIAESETVKPGLLIREGGKSVLLTLENVLFLSKVGRKAQIMCVDGAHLAAKNPAELIPSGLKDHFVRCHQGYWVNIAQIAELDHEEFVLKGGSRIPISRTFREEAKRRFLDQYRI